MVAVMHAIEHVIEDFLKVSGHRTVLYENNGFQFVVLLILIF